jgi:aspartate kinase
MKIKVLKFGGSSQKKDTYEYILNRVKEDKTSKYIIVLSAIKGITDMLLEFVNTKNFSLWKQIININKNLNHDLSPKLKNFINEIENKNWDLENDMVEIVSMGEFMTTNILNDFLNNSGVNSKFISSYEVIKSSLNNVGLYNKGEFEVLKDKIFAELVKNDVLIIPGFSGSSLDGKPCLLGRGGSDTSGSIIASSIKAECYEIWTDVDGIYTSDPRFIKNTKIIENIDYDSAQEMAAMGAKIIHPYSILPCSKENIPIIIKNSFNVDCDKNTKIFNYENQNKIYGISLQNRINVFNITSPNMWNNYGFVFDIFNVFKKYNVDVNIINTSQFNISTTTDESCIETLNYVVEELKNKYYVELSSNNTIISLVSDKIRKCNLIGKIFEITQKYNIIMTSYSSNDMTLSWVINQNDSIIMAQELHDFLF